jgi:Tol biopolymer transport system component
MPPANSLSAPAVAGVALAAVLGGFESRDSGPSSGVASSTLAPGAPLAPRPDETRLSSIRKLTDGGENAEAYWSSDGSWITFQSSREGRACDQQYVMRPDGKDVRRVSTGDGKTTCGWFLAGNRRVFFGSSHAHQKECPPKPDPSAGYVWPLDPFDIYTANLDGSDLKRLTYYNVYTAEGVLSPDGQTIVFTSMKDGDLDIYTMNVDGSGVKRLTSAPGYDGGPWWSPDGKKIVYRAHHPQDEKQLADYRSLLARNMIRPSRVEIFTMNADGSDQKQITALGGANFGPSWTPDGKRIIFSSNFVAPRSGNFDLYLVDATAERAGPEGVERVTTDPSFDGFPMFHPNGRKLLWASNRHSSKPTDTNLFVAEWK